MGCKLVKILFPACTIPQLGKDLSLLTKTQIKYNDKLFIIPIFEIETKSAKYRLKNKNTGF